MTTVASGSGGNVTTTLDATETVNASSNSSTYSWSLSQVITNDTHSGTAYAVSVTINGVTKSANYTWATGTTSSRVVLSGTTTVAHGSNGTKSFSVSFSTGALAGTTGGAATSGSGNVTATNIPPGASGKPALNGAVTLTSIPVKWASSGNGSAESDYQIQLGTTSAFTSTNTKTTTGLTATFTGLAKNTTYYFRARGHNASGYGDWSATFSASTQAGNVPGAVTNLSSNPLVTTAWVGWIDPNDDGGQPITAYKVDVSTSPTFTTATTTFSTGPSNSQLTITGLSAATTYYLRAYASNAVGDGPYASLTIKTGNVPGQVPSFGMSQPDPTKTTVHILVNPETPDPVAPTSAYRVQYGLSSDFAGATTYTTSSPLWGIDISGLLNGQTYYFRVAAVNVGGAGPYSPSGSYTPYTGTGNLDGWAAIGTLPSGATGLGENGTLRSPLPWIAGSHNGLLKHVTGTATGTFPAGGTSGIARTFTGLDIGATYTFNASFSLQPGTAPKINTYAIGVWNGATFVAATGTYTVTTGTTTGTVTFVAPAASLSVRIVSNPGATGVAFAANDIVENVGIFNVQMIEQLELTPYRLQDTAYQGSLADHFDYACNAVGAAWWVDSENVTQFRRALDFSAFKATFSDDSTGDLSYTDIQASYDTKNVVNALTVHNHGYDPVTGNADDVDYLEQDTDSQVLWGVRNADADMTLYAEDVYTNLHPDPNATAITWWKSGSATTTMTTGTGAAGPLGLTTIVNATTAAAASCTFYIGSGNAHQPCTAGDVINVSAYFQPVSVNRTGTINVRFFNASGTQVGSDVAGTATTYTAGVWTYGGNTVTAPATATSFDVFISFTGAASATLIRASAGQIVIGSTTDVFGTALPFFSGNSPSSGFLTYAWTGTPNASASTRTYDFMANRVSDIFAEGDAPKRLITGLTFNAQDNIALAAGLDIQDRLLVKFLGTEQDSRVIGIRHEFSPTRWLVTLDLQES